MNRNALSSIPRIVMVLLLVAATATISVQLRGGPSSVAANVSNQLALGVQAQRSGDYQSAIAHYLAVQRLEPRSPIPLFDAGDAEEFAGDLRRARQYYDQCLALDATYVPALYNEAVMAQTSNSSGAIALYRRVIAQSKPGSAQWILIAKSHYNLGLLLEKRGQGLEGRAQVALGIKLDPGLAPHTQR